MFDFLEDRPLDLLQVPLIIQDVSLLRALGLDYDLALARSLELMEQVAEAGGVLTLLWHNNWQPEDSAFRLYRTLLEHANSLGAWGCSVSDLEHHWRRRLSAQTDVTTS